MKNAILFKVFIGLLILIALPSQIIAQSADDILGVWIVPERDAKVEIYKTPEGLYNGKIVWLLEPLDPKGKPRLDIHNKDEALAILPLIGLDVVKNFTFHPESGKWIGGEVYNSRNGKRYAGFIKIMDDGTLFLRGHVKGLKFLGKTNIWERSSL